MTPERARPIARYLELGHGPMSRRAAPEMTDDQLRRRVAQCEAELQRKRDDGFVDVSEPRAARAKEAARLKRESRSPK